MSKISKSKEVKKLAWSSKDWIYLARITPNATRERVKNIMLEFQRAVLPKTEARIRLGLNGEGIWENITDDEYKIIENARIIWGLKKDKLPWSREHEILALRIALRLWKYKSDSLIITLISNSTNSRKKWLLAQLKELNQHKVWSKLTFNLNPATILDDTSHLGLNQAELSVIKRWKPILEELDWKQKQITAIDKWLIKNPHIATIVGNKWKDAWTYQASFQN